MATRKLPDERYFKNKTCDTMICNKLRDVRRRKKLTQQQVADGLGVDRKWVSRVENHPRDLPMSTFYRYAAALGVTITLNISES